MNLNGKLACKISNDQVSKTGGWCAEISGRNSSQHMTDFNLASKLSEILSGKCVASFGDGPGVYKEYVTSLKQVECYDAFDGAPFVKETTNGLVNFIDLSVPVYHLNEYDWIISLEVAEHIPAEFESIYIDNLVRHAKEGIVLSWAREGQTGHSHINNRNFAYVKTKLEEKGFMHHEKLSQLLQKSSTFDWFRNNINVYIRLSNKNFNYFIKELVMKY